MSDEDAIIREMIRHEDQLRDQRLGYLLTLNGFLFAALAFAWNADEAIPLVCLLAFVGFVIGWSARAAQNISERATGRLRDGVPSNRWPPVIGVQSVNIDPWDQRLVPWTVLPWLLIGTWPVVALVRVLSYVFS